MRSFKKECRSFKPQRGLDVGSVFQQGFLGCVVNEGLPVEVKSLRRGKIYTWALILQPLSPTSASKSCMKGDGGGFFSESLNQPRGLTAECFHWFFVSYPDKMIENQQNVSQNLIRSSFSFQFWTLRCVLLTTTSKQNTCYVFFLVSKTFISRAPAVSPWFI